MKKKANDDDDDDDDEEEMNKLSQNSETKKICKG